MNTRITHTIAIGLLLVGAAACGSDAGADVPDTAPAAGACPVDDPNCYETGAEVSDPPGADPGAAGGACPVDDPDCYETGAESGDAPADPSTGMCAPDVTDCVDVVVDESGDFDIEAATSAARELLGVVESDLPDDMRVARRGDEFMALTEDYVLGRLTVELDEQAGDFVVTVVTVELPDGAVAVTSESD